MKTVNYVKNDRTETTVKVSISLPVKFNDLRHHVVNRVVSSFIRSSTYTPERALQDFTNIIASPTLRSHFRIPETVTPDFKDEYTSYLNAIVELVGYLEVNHEYDRAAFSYLSMIGDLERPKAEYSVTGLVFTQYINLMGALKDWSFPDTLDLTKHI